MADLAEKTLACITEIEQFAREASQRPWFAEDNFIVDDNGSVGRFEIKADARLAALNGPEAVLRRCAADREIVEECRQVIAQENARDHWGGWVNASLRSFAELTLEHVARGYGIQP